ncbi:hypothetical protein AcV7_006326 [Taiwanofungus camphoratus]|nr:hypothetical protein AcV7_006326 [Antrodia cinnamomea]
MAVTDLDPDREIAYHPRWIMNGSRIGADLTFVGFPTNLRGCASTVGISMSTLGWTTSVQPEASKTVCALFHGEAPAVVESVPTFSSSHARLLKGSHMTAAGTTMYTDGVLTSAVVFLFSDQLGGVD